MRYPPNESENIQINYTLKPSRESSPSWSAGGLLFQTKKISGKKLIGLFQPIE
jgi:hypothetical protein